MQGVYKGQALKNLTDQIFLSFAAHISIILNHKLVLVLKFPVEIVKPQEIKYACKVLLISN